MEEQEKPKSRIEVQLEIALKIYKACVGYSVYDVVEVLKFMQYDIQCFSHVTPGFEKNLAEYHYYPI